MADLPGWVTNALASLGTLASNADRQTRLGYGAAVQGVANQFGYPIPDPQQDATYPYFRQNYPVSVHHDISAEAYRGQVQPELSPAASWYAGQVPVGDVWTDKAPLLNTQWNGQNNPAVGTKGWKNGTRTAPIAPGLPPFAAMYISRPSPKAAVPEQGYWTHYSGGDNSGAGANDAGHDEWTMTAPSQPAVADPSQTNAPMDSEHQMQVRRAAYSAILKQMGGIDTNKFNQDLGTYMRQDPSVYNDIAWINNPFYTNMPDDKKLEQIWAVLAAKRGAALKNTPVGSHYTGVLK
jgi:hypothetical protein